MTLIADNEVSDELYETVKAQFEEKDLMALTMAIISINGWNRLAISLRTVPGSYQIK